MAGFSEYKTNIHQQHNPTDPYYLYGGRFGYNTEYGSPVNHGIQKDAKYFGAEPDILGASPDSVSNYSQRRNLHLSFSSTPVNDSPNSPEDPGFKSFASKSIGLAGLVFDHLLSHPLLVIRRQCQVHVQSYRYHLLPVTLIYPTFQVCQAQGISILWKGLGSSLVVKGMALAVEDVTSKVTPWPKEVNRHGNLKSFFQHILLKSVSIAAVTPFYSASLVETVQSELASETAGFFDVFREGFWRLCAWPHTGRMVPIHVLVIPTVAHGVLSYIIVSSVRSVALSTIKRVRESKERKQGALSKDSSFAYYMEMTASLIGNMVADVLLYPLETILHRLHLQGTRTLIDNLDTGLEVTPIITSYNGVADCIRTTIEEEGFSGLYKGFGALILQYGLQILLIRTVKIALEKNPFAAPSIDKLQNHYPQLYAQGGGGVHQSRSEPVINPRSSPPTMRSPVREMFRDKSNPLIHDSGEDLVDYSPRPRSRFSKYENSPEAGPKSSSIKLVKV